MRPATGAAVFCSRRWTPTSWKFAVPTRGPSRCRNHQRRPTYDSNTPVRVAHDAVGTIEASLIEGSVPANAPARIRIDDIRPDRTGEPDTATTPSTILYIERDGQREPLTVDSTVDAADFGRIRWDAGAGKRRWHLWLHGAGPTRTSPFSRR